MRSGDGLKQGQVNVSAAGTAQRLSATSLVVRSVELHARNNLTTANTGSVYLGSASGSGQQYRVLAPGESYSISVPPGSDYEGIDLHDLWIDAATTGDGVTFTALV